MKFTPQTEADIKKSNLLPEGEYDCEIGTAEDKVSKTSGNEMIQVDLTVFDADGKKHFVYDYLMEKMAFKLRHAAEACGLLDKYEAGQLEADDFINKCCKVKVAIDDKNKDYPPKNVIKDYIVVGGTKSQKAKEAAISKPLDDSIPF